MSTSFADVFSWKDENSVMHFTDTPPPEKTVNDKQLSIMKTAPKTFYHKYYKNDGEDEYCGSQRMNTNDDDPRRALINAYHQAASGYKNKRFYRKEYSRLLSGEDQSYARTNKSIKYGGRDSMEKSMGECDCKIEWAEKKIGELNSYVDIIFKEAEVANQQYNDATPPDCGDRPSSGWSTDQEKKDWYNCMEELFNKTSKNKRNRNRNRKPISTKESLLSAIKAYNEAK